ncbi:uncharacterized protein UV8b_07638 [Ustilaginoidea virens]|uniref:Uncharacterized protein n=1 Tax=Ustilaginoidea virens TaxID=1159556 RepID=A0A8E5HXP8_USTVR|nr:uncharacterized protein UV8b_07638 [Ustilaginoidea virens]QUC23397.1 hypothetical protein UV8b_07638 [Ustilaginoidea virens]
MPRGQRSKARQTQNHQGNRHHGPFFPASDNQTTPRPSTRPRSLAPVGRNTDMAVGPKNPDATLQPVIRVPRRATSVCGVRRAACGVRLLRQVGRARARAGGNLRQLGRSAAARPTLWKRPRFPGGQPRQPLVAARSVQNVTPRRGHHLLRGQHRDASSSAESRLWC